MLSSMKIDGRLLESPPADTELQLSSVMVITLTNEHLKLMQDPRMLNTGRCQDKCKGKKDAQPFLTLNSACYSTLNNKLKQSLAYIAEEIGSQ